MIFFKQKTGFIFITALFSVLCGIVFNTSSHAASGFKIVKTISQSLGKIRLTAECDISSLETRVIQSNGFDLLTISRGKFNHYAKDAGDPVLPVKIVSVFIPDGYEFEKIEQISVLSQYELQVSNIYPRQLASPLSLKEKQTFTPLKKNVARKNSLFPKTSIEYLHTARIRGRSIAVFRFWPVQFFSDTKKGLKPGKGRLFINENVEYTFVLKKKTFDKKEKKYKKSNLAASMDQYIQSIVINPEEMITESELTAKDDEILLSVRCDYLIITHQDLVPRFQVLASHRQAMGLTAQVISIEDIYDQYTEGSSNQDKIKQCIKEYAVQKGTLWVLLGGDNTIVPDYDCFASVNSGKYTTTTIPTDLFYAGLDDMDWNDDNDGRACECNEDGDTIDLYPDVFIGRAPVRSDSEASAFVAKVMTYETGDYDPFFHEAALFMGVEVWHTYEGISDAQWRCEALWEAVHKDMEPVLSAQKYRFYDTGTDFDGDSNYIVSASHLVDQISSGYGIMLAETHGSCSSLSLEGSNYFVTGNVADCTNQTRQGIIYTTACNTNWFDHYTDPGLSEGFIRSLNGGSVAYIGSSRYGWGYSVEGPDFTLGPSLAYALEFFKALYYDEYLDSGGGNSIDSSLFNKRLGAVFASHKLYYAPASIRDGANRWLQFSLSGY